MEILITGGNGFLGRELKKYLQLSSNNIYTLNRKGGDYQVDLALEVPKFTRSFDCVIHAAGLAHIIPKGESQSKAFFDVNVEGTKNLLKGLELSGNIKHFIFISSVSVYGLTTGLMINEEHSLDAKDPYGLSKIYAEELVKLWCESHNIPYSILRLPLIAGENPNGNLAGMINAIKKGYYFNIGGGHAKKSIVLTRDIAAIVPKLVQANGGVFNLTDGYHPSFQEISNFIAKQINKRKPLDIPFFLIKPIALLGDSVLSFLPINTLMVKKMTSDLTFDDSKARKVLGWNPTTILNGFIIK